MQPFQMSNESVTVYDTDGEPHTFLAGSVQYNQMAIAINQNDNDAVLALLKPGAALQNYLGERFRVVDQQIFYRNDAFIEVDLPQGLSDRIREMANQGLDPSNLLRFYERLDRNPSYRSREQAYNFLAHTNIAIQPDGTFLAYKSVQADLFDKHSGTIKNEPGAVIKMPRNRISDDPEKHCHVGLHVGAEYYATKWFASSGDQVVIVEVDPEHIVCVPEDHSAQKMRVCEYKVVGLWNGQTMAMDEEAVYEDEDFEDFLDEDEDEEDDLDEDEEDDLDEDCDCNSEACPYKSDEQASSPTPKALTRGDLKPGTVFFYEDASYATFAVDNVALAGAPVAICLEKCPALLKKVVVVWDPTQQEIVSPIKQEVLPIFKKVRTPAFDKFNTKELMEQTIERLRLYAQKKLKIVGASKIPGGKSALVAKIIKARRSAR